MVHQNNEMYLLYFLANISSVLIDYNIARSVYFLNIVSYKVGVVMQVGRWAGKQGGMEVQVVKQ